MPRDGSGQYTLPQPPFVDGTIISAPTVNSDFSDIAAALTGSVARDGQSAMQGALNMGNFRITNLAAPTLTTDATRKDYVDSADALRLLLAGGTMSGAIAMGTNKITGLGAPTAGSADAATALYAETVANAAPATKIQVLNSAGFTGATDLGTGSGSAIAFTACDIILPDGVVDIFVNGWFIMDQTAAAANTARVTIQHLDSSLALLASFGTGVVATAGSTLNRTVTAPILGAREQVANVAGSRLRFVAWKDAANGPFNLVEMRTSVICTVR